MGPVALVTGANRGIGLEACRQLGARGYVVILGARDEEKGRAAAEPMRRDGINVRVQRLDVTNDQSVREAAALEWSIGRLDVLVNNAGILYDTWQCAVGAALGVVREAFETNTLGPWRVTQAFLPLLRRSGHGRIVNVSSGARQLGSLDGDTPAYALSKAALNALTLMLAAELKPARIFVNAACPGWVATDMGGVGGRPVAEGAAGVVWAATLPDDGPTGGNFRESRPIPW
jgi:NAD(P)-dependent dehydrogenase (short-subunit alcohol dehydrogenase family)